jgi:hypothetical protein
LKFYAFEPQLGTQVWLGVIVVVLICSLILTLITTITVTMSMLMSNQTQRFHVVTVTMNQ